ncbi:MAG: hypothetical protein AAFO07_32170 [Bacteroidota bacterium]
MKNRSWQQIVALGLFLVVLPAGAYIFLKKGFDYRKSAFRELEEIAEVPNDLELTTVDGRLVNRDSLKNKVAITNFFSLRNEALSETFGEQLEKLYDQFDRTSNLVLLVMATDTTYDSQDKIAAFAKEHDLWKQSFCYVIAPKGNDVAGLAKLFKLPEYGEQTLGDQPYFAFIDSEGVLRKYYNANEQEEMVELVTHTAMLMPRKPRRRIQFKRESEK